MIAGVSFESMAESDLDWVVDNERQLHPFPWTRGNFVDSMSAGYVCRIMKVGGTPVAYAITLIALDEAHLLNLSVVKCMQGQGVGATFLAYLFDEARRLGTTQIFLEVRPSNGPALELYRRTGFVPIGRRNRYYPAANGSREDAIVMRFDL